MAWPSYNPGDHVQWIGSAQNRTSGKSEALLFQGTILRVHPFTLMVAITKPTPSGPAAMTVPVSWVERIEELA